MKYRFAALAVVLVLSLLMPGSTSAIHSASVPATVDIAYQDEQIEVITQSADSLTQSSALLTGYVSSLGPYESIDVWFELSNGQSTSRQSISSPGPFSASIRGLSPGTNYDFQIIGTSTLLGGQRAEGSYVSFQTIPSIPKAPIVIATGSASDISSSTATLNGYLSSMGPYDTVRVTFNWGTSTSYGHSTGEQTLYSPGPFSMQISGLNPNSSYYFRAAAMPEVIGVSPAYGSASGFATSGGGNLSVSTGAESNVSATSATITGYLDSMGPYSGANTWFEWGTTTSYGQVTRMQTAYSPGQFNYSLQGLVPGTTYHFRALALPSVTGGATANGLDSMFTTSFAPSARVSTSTATSITNTTAILNGYLTSTGASSATYIWFEYGTNTTFGNSTPQQVRSTPGNFSYSLSRLLPGTTYYYRAAALTNGTSVYGQYSTFQTTASSPISITTNPASNLTGSVATLNAYVNSLGTLPSAQVWFNYGTTPGMGKVTQQQTFAAPGPVAAAISGLSAGTSYYYQVVAQAPDGSKVLGSQSTFTTTSTSRLSVSTNSATAITSSSATLNGNLDDPGNSQCIQAWFEYGRTADFGNTTEIQTLNSAGAFSTHISGLIPQATYYYRTIVLNPTAGSRPVKGAVTSFVTAYSPNAPTSRSSDSVPAFIWLIGAGLIIIIVILVILLIAR